jgi:3-oxoacyl-[acyl-carrier-protein] synthase II
MLKRAVITGMGVVSPNGIGKTAFCRAILGGKSGVKTITRFDASELPIKIAGEIQDFNELDWVEARERKHVSRCVPLAIAAATEAVTDAGLDPAKLSLDQQREIGVVLGTGGGAQEFSELQYHLYYTGKVKQVSLFTIPSGTMGTMSSEVSMRFGFRGLSHVITTGCTSSTDAIAYAARQIQLGVQEAMLVGGVDAPLAFGIMKAFTLMRIMTESWNNEPERGSRPFNLDRDGFVIAEGAWMFVIEDYERAKARGAHIYAEIAGYGSTCEAFHRVRLQECGEEPAISA